jgi:hypothetical protein
VAFDRFHVGIFGLGGGDLVKRRRHTILQRI